MVALFRARRCRPGAAGAGSESVIRIPRRRWCLGAPDLPRDASASRAQLGSLVAGFLLLVIGLAVLTVRHHRHPLPSSQGTRRALSYAVIYALCSACFVRVISSALL